LAIRRVTVSIPAQLRDRMEAYPHPVNWSAVAARAFEAVVGLTASDPVQTNPDMTVIPPQPTSNGTGTGVRLLDEEDRALLQRDLDAGRIVAIYDQTTGMNLTYARCTNAAAIREVFIAYAGDFDIRE
jgi:hypothetical protein